MRPIGRITSTMSQLSKTAEKQLSQRLKDQAFRDLFDECMAIGAMLQARMGGRIAVQVPQAHQIKSGERMTGIYAVPGDDPEKQLELFAGVDRIFKLAVLLSRYFPEARRWHWQQVIPALALGDDATVKQRYAGGRPKRMSATKAEKYMEIARDYERSGNLSQSEFCKRHQISRATLYRALNFAKLSH